EAPLTRSLINGERTISRQVNHSAIQCGNGSSICQGIVRSGTIGAKRIGTIVNKITANLIGSSIVLFDVASSKLISHRLILTNRDRQLAISLAIANTLDRDRNRIFELLICISTWLAMSLCLSNLIAIADLAGKLPTILSVTVRAGVAFQMQDAVLSRY